MMAAMLVVKRVYGRVDLSVAMRDASRVDQSASSLAAKKVDRRDLWSVEMMVAC